METWLIVLITVGSGLALFIAILWYKTKEEKKRQASMLVNQTTMGIHVVGNQSTPYNPYHQQQYPIQNYNQPQVIPHQGQPVFINTPIPSTANQGAFNMRNPGPNLSTKVFHGPVI